ncbi:hypothetical protein GAMM_120017 [Gammaproteobacteria bacterium]
MSTGSNKNVAYMGYKTVIVLVTVPGGMIATGITVFGFLIKLH